MNQKILNPSAPPTAFGGDLPGAALLQLYASILGGSVRQLANRLQISNAYASMLMRGTRPMTAKLGKLIADAIGDHPNVQTLGKLVLNLEAFLGRPLSEGEVVALVPGLGTQSSLLQDLIATARRFPAREGTDMQRIAGGNDTSFDVASALSGLTSLADILVEEPDLPTPQRTQFQRGVQSAAQRLRTLLDIREQDEAPQSSMISSLDQRPERYVDHVFLDQGYHFAELEAEADLIVRRARRHGPLGTFALIARLEHDHGREVAWVEGAGMAPSSVGLAAAGDMASRGVIELDPSLGQSQLRFRLSQFLVAHEAAALLDTMVTAANPPSALHARSLKKALVAYTAAAMFMPYEAFLMAAHRHRYDIDWLARHFGCSFDQVCHRLIALRKPGQPGVPFGMLRVSPAGQTITRIALPGLALPDRQAACPLWAAYGALQRPGETLTQLAEFPDGNRFLLIGRTAAGPRAHFGQPRRLTSVMLACDWAYADALIYADAHDPGRIASITHVGSSCVTCPRAACENRVEPQLTSGMSSAKHG